MESSLQQHHSILVAAQLVQAHPIVHAPNANGAVFPTGQQMRLIREGSARDGACNIDVRQCCAQQACTHSVARTLVL